MTRRALMLHLLREAGERGVTTGELLHAGVGSRYSARLLELRSEGHVVEAERIRGGAWRYTLTHDAERSTAPLSSSGGAALGVAAPPPAPTGTGGQPTETHDSPTPTVVSAEPPAQLFTLDPASYRDHEAA